MSVSDPPVFYLLDGVQGDRLQVRVGKTKGMLDEPIEEFTSECEGSAVKPERESLYVASAAGPVKSLVSLLGWHSHKKAPRRFQWVEGTDLMGAMRPQTPHRSPRQAFGGNFG